MKRIKGKKPVLSKLYGSVECRPGNRPGRKDLEIDPNNPPSKEEIEGLLPNKWQVLAKEYIRDWNASRSARAAGYTAPSSRNTVCGILKRPIMIAYINYIKAEIAEEVGISKIGLLTDLKAVATSKVSEVYDDWIKLKDFEKIRKENPGIFKAIQEIDTKTEYRMSEDKAPIEIKYVKIKFYDKLRAIEDIFKAMGWNEPDKVNMNIEQPLFPDVPV